MKHTEDFTNKDLMIIYLDVALKFARKGNIKKAEEAVMTMLKVLKTIRFLHKIKDK